jgi:hypothetical protein
MYAGSLFGKDHQKVRSDHHMFCIKVGGTLHRILQLGTSIQHFLLV